MTTLPPEDPQPEDQDETPPVPWGAIFLMFVAACVLFGIYGVIERAIFD